MQNNDKPNIASKILDAIDILIDSKLKKLSFDKTFICTIISKQVTSTSNIYQLIIDGKKYSINSENNYSIGDKVAVKVPCNNWSNIYIEHKI